MRARRFLMPALILAIALALAASASAAKSYRGEHFQVRVLIQPDGSLLVTETVRFALGPDSFTYVYRELPERRTDGISYLGASMDGVPMSAGRGPGQFEIKKRDGGHRRVIWHFAPATSSSHTFTLTYAAAGVVRQEADADVLAWTLLPRDHEYSIDCASVHIEFPASATLLGPAAFNPPPGDLQAEGRTIRATRCPFEPDASWVVTMRFSARTAAAIAPVWQQRERRTREHVPMFLGLGGLILLTGIGGFVFLRLNHRPEFPDDPNERVPAPPDSLPVSLAGALAHNATTVAWGPTLGTLMDLARRGAVGVEEGREAGRFRTRGFVVRRSGTPAPLAPHEQVLLDLLFTTKAGPRDSITFSEMSRVVASSGRWKRFRKAVMEDLRGAGLLDAERERGRSRTMKIGVAIALSGVVALAGCVPFMPSLGDSLLILPVALLIVGIVGIVVGTTLSPLSADGQRRARLWKGYRRYLHDASKRMPAQATTPEMFEKTLPYAVAFGVALAWARHLEQQGFTGGPAWLQSAGRDGGMGPGQMAATIAMLSAGSEAGAHAGASASVGGAGAAGGGASGAG